MSLQDKTLTCTDCGKEFTFTVGEQEYYISKQFENEPKRCGACRQARKGKKVDQFIVETAIRNNGYLAS